MSTQPTRKGAANRTEPDEFEKDAMRSILRRYEEDNDVVPGTASWEGWTPKDLGRPSGGVRWEDRSRMAHARAAAGVELDDGDRDAMARFPDPRSGVR